MNEPITIPGYRMLRELGTGGMATVHLAIQESFDREVALKIMSPLFNVDPSFATRFVREARIISQIHHASIVPVHDVGEHRRHQYLSMEEEFEHILDIAAANIKSSPATRLRIAVSATDLD